MVNAGGCGAETSLQCVDETFEVSLDTYRIITAIIIAIAVNIQISLQLLHLKRRLFSILWERAWIPRISVLIMVANLQKPQVQR